MKENNLLSVNQIYHIEISKLMQKYALKTIPSPFISIFKKLTRTSSTTTRSGTTIIPGSSSTAKCAQSIRCTGPKIWNNIPREIRFTAIDDTNIANHSPTPLKQFISKMKTFAIHEIDFIQ